MMLKKDQSERITASEALEIVRSKFIDLKKKK
jgi:hypothetical protein